MCDVVVSNPLTTLSVPVGSLTAGLPDIFNVQEKRNPGPGTRLGAVQSDFSDWV